MLCYIPTGFGETDVSTVTADIDKYESFYPAMCDGFFFDEGPGGEDNAWKCELLLLLLLCWWLVMVFWCPVRAVLPLLLMLIC